MKMRMRMRMRLSLSFAVLIYIVILIVIHIVILVDSYFIFCFFIFFIYNIWFNRQKILQKAKERYSKEKAAEYYMQNKEVIKEKSRNRYKNLSEEEKTKLKSIKRKDIKN